MKQIKKSNPLEEKLEENHNNSISPNKIYTVNDVLTTKDKKDIPKIKRKETSVRVFKETQLKLKILNQFMGTEHVDDLINKMIDEFVPEHMSKENKKVYLTMLEIALSKEKST